MWFLALGSGDEVWFRRLLQRVLEADRPTMRLFAVDPFAGERPRWVRAVRYRYRFASRAEFRQDGDIWRRDRLGIAAAPMRLRS